MNFHSELIQHFPASAHSASPSRKRGKHISFNIPPSTLKALEPSFLEARSMLSCINGKCRHPILSKVMVFLLSVLTMEKFGIAYFPSNFGSEPKKPTNTEHPNFGTTSDSPAKRQALLSLSNKGWEIQLFPCRWLSWPWINAGWELSGSTREVLAYRQHRGDLLSQLSYCLTQAAVHPGQVTTSQPLADGSVLLLETTTSCQVRGKKWKTEKCHYLSP